MPAPNRPAASSTRAIPAAPVGVADAAAETAALVALARAEVPDETAVTEALEARVSSRTQRGQREGTYEVAAAEEAPVDAAGALVAAAAEEAQVAFCWMLTGGLALAQMLLANLRVVSMSDWEQTLPTQQARPEMRAWLLQMQL